MGGEERTAAKMKEGSGRRRGWRRGAAGGADPGKGAAATDRVCAREGDARGFVQEGGG